MALSIGSSNLIDLGSLDINGFPFTLTGWFRVPDLPALMTLIRIKNSVTNSIYGLNFEGHLADRLALMTNVTATSVVRSTVPMISNQWHHVTGIFESAISRRVYLDGGNKASVNHPRPFDGADEFWLGNLISTSTVDVAEFAIIAAVPNDDEIRMLSHGISPIAVCDPSTIFCYHDCLRNTNRPGGGPIATGVGSGSAVDHPRILNARGTRATVQPCRFSGPYQAVQSELETSGLERAACFVPSISGGAAEVSAA